MPKTNCKILKPLTALKGLLFCLSLVFFITGCRKNDATLSLSDEAIEARFFTLSDSVNADVRAVVQRIKADNDRHHFVASFVKENGYPDWSKVAMTSSEQSTQRGSNAPATQQSFLIPFVQNGEVKDYLVCARKDSVYKFKNYKKSSFPSVAPSDSVKKKNLIAKLFVFAYFEKIIHGKSQTSFQNNFAGTSRTLPLMSKRKIM